MSEAHKKVLAISGSTKKHSTNECILKAIKNTYRDHFTVKLYDSIAQLPHFRSDIKEKDLPASVRKFRKLIDQADGVLICTPEYVFSLPGALKNALEWTVATTVFTDKPLAYVIASASGEKAFESLHLIMKTLGAQIAPHSRLLIKGAKSKVNKHSHITDISTQKALKKLVHSFNRSMDE